MLIKFYPMAVDEDTGTDEDDYSELLRSLEVEYVDTCGSSYQRPCRVIDIDAKWFVTAKRNDAMFTQDSVKNGVPSTESGVYCKHFVDEKKYNVVYFIDPRNPHEWFGFASYSYTETITSSYSLFLTLELIYIKPKYRRESLGYVAAYELGRLISSETVFCTDKISQKTTEVYVTSYSQGVNPAGAICLERFYAGLRFHFEVIEDFNEREYWRIPSMLELVDEY